LLVLLAFAAIHLLCHFVLFWQQIKTLNALYKAERTTWAEVVLSFFCGSGQRSAFETHRYLTAAGARYGISECAEQAISLRLFLKIPVLTHHHQKLYL
jgi:hypothetical protein